MEANRRTNHYKTFDWFKFENVLNIIITVDKTDFIHRFTKSDLRKWFENYNHTADFGKMDFNAFWNNVRGVECDYILKHFIKPTNEPNNCFYGFAAVGVTMALIIAAIAFYKLVLSF